MWINVQRVGGHRVGVHVCIYCSATLEASLRKLRQEFDDVFYAIAGFIHI